MRHTATKLLLLLGLSIVWIAGNSYFDNYRYFRRDWLLLTVIEEHLHHLFACTKTHQAPARSRQHSPLMNPSFA
jgi:hypothetical protein